MTHGPDGDNAGSVPVPEQLPVAILCGGRGTRLHEHVSPIPKPLVEIGGHPILWHVIRIYAAQGTRRFLLCLGYKADLIEEFVAATEWPDDVEIECIHTGLDTPTGARIAQLAGSLGDRAFFATYADGVADIDLRALRDHHDGGGCLATVTVVRPPLPFGVAEVGEDDRVCGFREKPRSELWVNGGFFVFEPRVFDYLDGDSVLEREPLINLARDTQLLAYRHEGFWDCMDTYKDALILDDLWKQDRAPWRIWE